jgi:hypothetical protein
MQKQVKVDFLIDDNFKRIRSCDFCTQLIQLFKIRHEAITFRGEAVITELNTLKKVLNPEWTTKNIDFLLDFYDHPVTELLQEGDGAGNLTAKERQQLLER